ncbi:MAG: protein-L-isoaspartate(D-aspartate) O-methyltransferase [Ignavibacteria bacterium]|nr:protein-L-isoaspartate(D-aspartate) O-methyltransferase [Ignavibacteria bacterium]
MGLLQDMERKQLVDLLRKQGISDEKVLNAMGRVSREFFVIEELRRYAYDNVALPIEGNQTISQPFTVAFMTQLLNVNPGDKVLEIGTGSGYQTAVLCELGAKVHSVERISSLYQKAGKTLASLGYDAKLKLGDGTLGWKEHQPYDGIIVTAGAPQVPDALIRQLSPGGRLIIPVGTSASQEVHLVTRDPSQNFEDEPEVSVKKYNYFRFVPLIGEEGWKDGD